MIVKIYACKKVWFDVDINDLATLPEDARTPFIEAKVREKINNIHEIEYSINSDHLPSKISDSTKEKVIL